MTSCIANLFACESVRGFLLDVIVVICVSLVFLVVALLFCIKFANGLTLWSSRVCLVVCNLILVYGLDLLCSLVSVFFYIGCECCFGCSLLLMWIVF